MKQEIFEIILVTLLAFAAVYWAVRVSVHVWPGI